MSEFESSTDEVSLIEHSCDKGCQWLATGLWFSPGILVSSTNKTDRHDITEILLKVVLNITTPNPSFSDCSILSIQRNRSVLCICLFGMFVLFLLAIVLSVFLRFTVLYYPFDFLEAIMTWIDVLIVMSKIIHNR